MVEVAIYIPTYNRPAVLPKTLRAIFRQNMPDFKLYILERSRGEYKDLIRTNLAKVKDSRLKVFYDDDFVPLGEAYNKLMFDYSDKDEKYSVIYVDDTIMIPDKLKILTSFLNNKKDSYLACGRFGIIDEFNELSNNNIDISYTPTIIGWFEAAESGWYCTDLCSSMIKREVIDKVGRIKVVEHKDGVDANYWKQIAMAGFMPIYGSQAIAKFCGLPEDYCLDLAFPETRDNLALRERRKTNENLPYE